VLSGRGLCDELTTSPEESCRLWCVYKPHEWGAIPNPLCDWASIGKCITGCVSCILFNVASPLAYRVFCTMITDFNREREFLVSGMNSPQRLSP